MKKLFFVLMTLALVNASMAQGQVPNGGFESWSGNQPNDWTTGLIGNVTTTIFGYQINTPVNTYFGETSSDAIDGYALRLHSGTLGIPSTNYSYPMPGVAQLGRATGFSIPLSSILAVVDAIRQLSQGDSVTFDYENFDWQSLSTIAEILAPGAPLAKTPEFLNMWVKFHPYGSDRLNVLAFTKKEGVPVGYAVYSSADPYDEYTLLRIPFENANEPCDTLGIIILSGGLLTNDSTELFIDNVQLETNDVVSVVGEYANTLFSCYPNPAEDYVCIQPISDEPYRYEVLDMQGRTVFSVGQAQGLIRINTKDFAKGLYLLNIYQQGQTYPQKILVR